MSTDRETGRIERRVTEPTRLSWILMWGARAGLMVAVVVGAACGPIALDEPVPGDDAHLDIPVLDSEPWVERFFPDRAFDGFNLVLFQRRIPMLMDMNGRIVHAWPLVRVSARARLDHRGRLLVMGIDNAIKIYDWDGHLVWRYVLPVEDDIPHHDVIWLANGNVLVLAQDHDSRLDYLQEVDSVGRQVWEWRFSDHLDAAFPDHDPRHGDPTHVNSIHEIGPNRWFDAGDERFRPGNLLLSARTLDAILVLDRPTGEVVWTFDRWMDRQHEAVMVPKNQPGDGLILVFNNGLRNRFAYRRSSILAIDPVSSSIPWEYRGRFFYSSLAGSQQPLPNGNVLISSSHGGRVFEVTPQQETVWQWLPPWEPMRVLRYPPGFCPQLRSLGSPGETPVPPQRRAPYVSQDLHTFSVSGEYANRDVAGMKRQLVKDTESCRQMILPSRPSLSVGYGLDGDAPGSGGVEARFVITVDRFDTGERMVLVDETISSGAAETWRQPWIPMPGLDHRSVMMCLQLDTPRGNGTDHNRAVAVIENPRVYSGDQPTLPRKWRDGALSDDERAIREQQLRAIGYIQ